MWGMVAFSWLEFAALLVPPVIGAAAVGWTAKRPIGCVVALLVAYVVLACLSASAVGVFLPPFWRHLWLVKVF